MSFSKFPEVAQCVYVPFLTEKRNLHASELQFIIGGPKEHAAMASRITGNNFNITSPS